MASNAILFITILSLINFMSFSLAFDTRPLLDFCVADSTGNEACKDPKAVTADDFFLSGLDRVVNSNNLYGYNNSFANVATVPGFNTLGMTLSRAEFAPNGYFPPHSHPRASEIITVTEGAVEVGFVTEYKYYSKIVGKGDVFIIPIGLAHIVRNVAQGNSVVVAALNSQNPGFVYIPNTILAAKPAIHSGYLAVAFKLDEKIVRDLQTKSWF